MVNSSDKANTMQPTVRPQYKLNVHMKVEHPNQEGDMSNCVLPSLLDWGLKLSMAGTFSQSKPAIARQLRGLLTMPARDPQVPPKPSTAVPAWYTKLCPRAVRPNPTDSVLRN